LFPDLCANVTKTTSGHPDRGAAERRDLSLHNWTSMPTNENKISIFMIFFDFPIKIRPAEYAF